MIPQHSSVTNEHYTPAPIVEAARATLGEIDLDPASCEVANRVVRATAFFDSASDGLASNWYGRVFLNPPGGRVRKIDGRWVSVKGGRAESSMAVWWDHLVGQWQTGSVASAVFVAFTLEILRISQGYRMPVQAFHRCYPRDRLCFGGDDPTHANVIVHLPDRGAHNGSWCRFHEAFSRFGLCERGIDL